MGDIVVATEALAAGTLTRHALQTQYLKLHQNIYIPRDFTLDAHIRAQAAWLWSGGAATLSGYSAAAVLGSKWLPEDAPAELTRIRHPAPPGCRIDMGRPEWMVGVEDDGGQHWATAEAQENDIVRLEFLASRGWTIVRVSARQLEYRGPEVVTRAWESLRRQGTAPTNAPRLRFLARNLRNRARNRSLGGRGKAT